MKLLNSFGPNPRMVRMFLLEKGIDVPMQEHDLLGAENRKPPYTTKNPAGQLPSLELDNGTVIAETVAICEYLDEINPGKTTLVGSNAEEKAISRMWQRRVELNITEFIYNGFRYAEGFDLFKDRLHVIPEAAPGLKAGGKRNLKWLDNLIGDRDFICGNQIRLADLVLYCCLDFAAGVGQPIDPEFKNIQAWFKRVDSRPSAKASLHPASEQVKMKG
ncbi:glutathione S-transferase [Panacagrimonas perspica]|uniref:Glutathione S-transferase n=1 Tax=Panacagrimonas perspica TaxID=381431 RepID=A0A4S3K9Q4_9GAMM|nr:glutathione S-transferase family protein [Panacagrimonas perspica]TDU28712.1 glutathione S-transferase [Panacagrimonas perspica]THD05035.1 glutathione S-transferase [Panacagrimonas perspica]